MRRKPDPDTIEAQHAELALMFARCRCKCGAQPVSYTPGDLAIREAGILLQRGTPMIGTCLRCLGLDPVDRANA